MFSVQALVGKSEICIFMLNMPIIDRDSDLPGDSQPLGKGGIVLLNGVISMVAPPVQLAHAAVSHKLPRAQQSVTGETGLLWFDGPLIT